MEAAQRARRLHAWARPICCAARWARRSSPRWTPSAPASSRAARRSTTSPRPKANELFDLIDKFAGYGFNKLPRRALCAGRLSDRLAQARIIRSNSTPPRCASTCTSPTSSPSSSTTCAGIGLECLPPAINASEAEFIGRAARRAASRCATRSARSRASARRRWRRWSPSASANGPFASLDDFAARIDPRAAQPPPDRKPRRRRRVRCVSPSAPRCIAAAETILAAAASAADARESGQGGLFGEGPANVVPIRMPARRTWTLAQRMAAEKESFGFYFSAHPVDDYRHLAARPRRAQLRRTGRRCRDADGGRASATMAGLVEDARWRTSARGRRYMMATLSDASGQFDATVFDDPVAEQVAAMAQGGHLHAASMSISTAGRARRRRASRSARFSRSRAWPSASGSSSRSRLPMPPQ